MTMLLTKETNQVRKSGRPIQSGMFDDEPRQQFITQGTATSAEGTERDMYFAFCRPCGRYWGYFRYEFAVNHKEYHENCDEHWNVMDHNIRQEIHRLTEVRDRAQRKIDRLESML